MKMFVQILQAELLKTKRTLVMWLTVIAPLVIVVLQIMVFLKNHRILESAEDQWFTFGRSAFSFWALLMLPLFVTLQTALLAGLEHREKLWRHIFALPLSRGLIYFAKQLVAVGYIGLSILFLWGMVLVAGFLLNLIRPNLLSGSVPWYHLTVMAGCVFIGSWLMISLHTWVGLRWSSFVIASAIGISATICGMIVINSEWGPYYPWAVPALIANQMKDGTIPWIQILFGGIGGIVAAVLGGLNFIRRDIE